jgi:hypothetical protein
MSLILIFWSVHTLLNNCGITISTRVLWLKKDYSYVDCRSYSILGRIAHNNSIYIELTLLNKLIIIYPILYAQLHVNP